VFFGTCDIFLSQSETFSDKLLAVSKMFRANQLKCFAENFIKEYPYEKPSIRN